MADLAAKEMRDRDRGAKAASAIIIAEQGRWYTAIIRPLLVASVIIYFWKVIVWDKVLGLGTSARPWTVLTSAVLGVGFELRLDLVSTTPERRS
jgi:hypothetical protein